ncbi:tripartite tricarboxylate transporter TctB family protein [Shinella sp. BE166]|uniref:tripartite tricarboxylate transporter TctB family protein n=1 Tax=unclassified Shinella TaxID=2643062 RepID=UPI003EB8760A
MHVTKDLLSGIIFMALGAGATVIGSSYRLGTLAAMGPGYFPVVLGISITALGALVAIRAALRPDSSEPLERLHLRPLLFVLAAVAVFGLLIQSYGLVASVLALVFLSRFSRTEGTWLELAAMLVVLTAIPVGVFVYGLGLPLKLWFF